LQLDPRSNQFQQQQQQQQYQQQQQQQYQEQQQFQQEELQQRHGGVDTHTTTPAAGASEKGHVAPSPMPVKALDFPLKGAGGDDEEEELRSGGMQQSSSRANTVVAFEGRIQVQDEAMPDAAPFAFKPAVGMPTLSAAGGLRVGGKGGEENVLFSVMQDSGRTGDVSGLPVGESDPQQLQQVQTSSACKEGVIAGEVVAASPSSSSDDDSDYDVGHGSQRTLAARLMKLRRYVEKPEKGQKAEQQQKQAENSWLGSNWRSLEPIIPIHKQLMLEREAAEAAELEKAVQVAAAAQEGVSAATHEEKGSIAAAGGGQGRIGAEGPASCPDADGDAEMASDDGELSDDMYRLSAYLPEQLCRVYREGGMTKDLYTWQVRVRAWRGR
jgi:hypothetical protein